MTDDRARKLVNWFIKISVEKNVNSQLRCPPKNSILVCYFYECTRFNSMCPCTHHYTDAAGKKITRDELSRLQCKVMWIYWAVAVTERDISRLSLSHVAEYFSSFSWSWYDWQDEMFPSTLILPSVLQVAGVRTAGAHRLRHLHRLQPLRSEIVSRLWIPEGWTSRQLWKSVIIGALKNFYSTQATDFLANFSNSVPTTCFPHLSPPHWCL